MQKFGTGQVLGEDGEPVRKTASRPLTDQDVRDIEREGDPAPQTEGE
jgi:hypothetical protein